jgi:hypothetical protein
MSETVEAIGYKADVPSRVRDAVNDRVDTVKGTIVNAISGAGDALSGAGEKLSDATGKLSDATSNIDVPESTRRAVSIAMENPLGLALGALAVGFLAGLVVPMSDAERQRAGRVADAVDAATTN